jgi:photosystem II PsbM protein
MEVNNLGLIATALFVIVPTVFLIILYVQTESQKGSG